MNELSVAVANFVFNAAWQSTAIVLLALAADRLLRRAPARARHAVLTMALLCAAIVPFVPHAGQVETPAKGGKSGVSPAAVAIQQASPAKDWTREWPVLRTSTAEPIAVLYALFVTWALFRLARAIRFARRLRAKAELSEQMRSTFERWRLQMHVQNARVALSDCVDSAVTVGAMRPLILLPASQGLGPALEPAVAHELAHVRRRDPLTQLLTECVTIPIAFNPLVAVLKRRLAVARESACDEMVTSHGVKPMEYARALLTVARSLSAPRCAVAFGGATALEERLRFLRFLASGSPGRRRGVIASFAVTIALSAAAVTVAACGVRPFSAHPNFTGDWQLDRRATRFGTTPSYERFGVTVSHEDNTFISRQRRERAGKVERVSWTVETDGVVRPFHVNGVQGRGNAKWNRDQLIFEIKTDAGHWERTVLHLANDGRTLVCDGEIREHGGGTKFRYVFARQGAQS